MGVQLNIKDAETVRLARELAAKTQQPVTAVIRAALQRELAAREADQAERLNRVREIVREFQAMIPEDTRRMSLKEIMDSIYDEDGLPE